MTLDLHGTLERDVDRARDVLRELLGGVALVREEDAVYAEIETRLDRFLVAAGGASLGRVAGGCNRTRLQVHANRHRRPTKGSERTTEGPPLGRLA